MQKEEVAPVEEQEAASIQEVELAPEQEVTPVQEVMPEEEVAPVQEVEIALVHEEEVEMLEKTTLVQEAPHFTQELTNMEVTEGGPMQFLCISVGHPRPEITWFLDGEEIHISPTYVIDNREDGTNILTIEETFAEDEGEYTCVAENELGRASTSADLYIRGKSCDLTYHIGFTFIIMSLFGLGNAHQYRKRSNFQRFLFS